MPTVQPKPVSLAPIIINHLLFLLKKKFGNFFGISFALKIILIFNSTPNEKQLTCRVAKWNNRFFL
jgi:hypothetical protein